MGVHGLWTILSPIQEHIPLRSLGGKKLAVDLSGWLCGDICVNQRVQTGCKLYLRNLLFRLIALLREAILPIAVTDGTAPALKVVAMQERRHFSRLNTSSKQLKQVSLKRSQFSRMSSQCTQLLRALGVPCIASPGEAEAMCAFLNMENLVDGCVTNDGDVFLYGATVVYRHFSLNSRNASVEAYSSEFLSTRIGLCRQSLVLLSLVLGCDYWPSGVSGIGPISAGQILAQVDIDEALKRLSRGSDTRFSDSDDDVEVWSSSIWLKITDGLAQCPVDQIVEEFLQPWQERGWQMPSSKRLVWARPNVRQAVDFCINFLDWKPLYALAQLTPLLAFWIIRSSNAESFAGIMQPLRIVKKRSVNYIPCLEVEWSRLSDDIWSSQLLLPDSSKENLITSLKGFFTNAGYRFPVPAVEFRSAFPQLADTFDVDSFPNLTAKMGALSVEDQKNVKRRTNKSKVKKTLSKNDGFPLDFYPESNQENELSSIAVHIPPPIVNTRKMIPSVEEIFTPSPVQLQKAESPINFISVQLNTHFERRLTLQSSLLTTETPPPSPSSIEFGGFRTPAPLRDRLS